MRVYNHIQWKSGDYCIYDSMLHRIERESDIDLKDFFLLEPPVKEDDQIMAVSSDELSPVPESFYSMKEDEYHAFVIEWIRANKLPSVSLDEIPLKGLNKRQRVERDFLIELFNRL